MITTRCRVPRACGITVLLACLGSEMAHGDEALRTECSRALRSAVGFFKDQVSTHGGYVYRYSADLSKREGEGKTDRDTVWVQPPGTPAVGLAYLDAFERTREKYLLDAARDAAECLLQGQFGTLGS